jgi:hypothetical protein
MIEGKPLTIDRIIEHIKTRRTNLSNRARGDDAAANGLGLGRAVRELTRLLEWIDEHTDEPDIPHPLRQVGRRPEN